MKKPTADERLQAIGRTLGRERVMATVDLITLDYIKRQLIANDPAAAAAYITHLEARIAELEGRND